MIASMNKYQYLPNYNIKSICFSFQSRPSHEQVMAIVDFMEHHPTLGLGQMRGMEGREESKKLWMQLTRLVNNITGPTRPMKSWMKVSLKCALFRTAILDKNFLKL